MWVLPQSDLLSWVFIHAFFLLSRAILYYLIFCFWEAAKWIMNICDLKENSPPPFTSWVLGFDVNKKYSSSNIYWEHTLCQALCQALWGMQIRLRNSSSICRIDALVVCELISQISLLLNFQMLPVTVINMCSQFYRNTLWATLTCFLKSAQQVSITQTFNTCFALLWGAGRCQPPTWEAALPRMWKECVCCWQRHLLAAGRNSD